MFIVQTTLSVSLYGKQRANQTLYPFAFAAGLFYKAGSQQGADFDLHAAMHLWRDKFFGSHVWNAFEIGRSVNFYPHDQETSLRTTLC